MAEEASPPGQQFSSEINMRLRDIEDKQRLLKDRVLLLGNTLIEEKESSFEEIQKMKKTLLQLEGENKRMKSILKNITEQVDNSARKEELMILQRQFDLFRE